MVRECRPRERELSSLKLARRSTMTTSVPANVSSAASIIPVGPPPAITTACSAILLNLPAKMSRQRRTERGACGKPRGALYSGGGAERVLFLSLNRSPERAGIRKQGELGF